jgi:hypothetical protein
VLGISDEGGFVHGGNFTPQRVLCLWNETRSLKTSQVE